MSLELFPVSSNISLSTFTSHVSFNTCTVQTKTAGLSSIPDCLVVASLHSLGSRLAARNSRGIIVMCCGNQDLGVLKFSADILPTARTVQADAP